MVVFLLFGALVVYPRAAAGAELPDAHTRVDLTDGREAVVADIDFRGRDLRIVVPHELGTIDVDDADAEPSELIEIVIDRRTLRLDPAMTRSAAFAIARIRLEPRLAPSENSGPRNQLADRSEFARVSGELRHMLELALPRHAELGHRLDDLCELACANAGLKVVADALAAAALLMGRDDRPDAEMRALVGSLMKESVTAVALRVGVSCPACEGAACVLEAARPAARRPPSSAS